MKRARCSEIFTGADLRDARIGLILTTERAVLQKSGRSAVLPHGRPMKCAEVVPGSGVLLLNH